MEIFLEFQRGRETYPIFRAEEKRLERLIRESFVAKRGKLSRTRAILPFSKTSVILLLKALFRLSSISVDAQHRARRRIGCRKILPSLTFSSTFLFLSFFPFSLFPSRFSLGREKNICKMIIDGPSSRSNLAKIWRVVKKIGGRKGI